MKSEDFYAFCGEFGFPEEACRELLENYEKLLSFDRARMLLEDVRARWERGESLDFCRVCGDLRGMRAETRVHPFTSDMIFYLYLAPTLRKLYEKRGYPARWFTGVMEDLRCKLLECRTVYGIWGSFVSSWFARFYQFSLFAMGRLEFCLIPCPFDYEKGGLSIRKGQKCVDVHIPSKGKLVRRELADSYREAAEFFGPMLEAPVAFYCESWLLFEHHAEMLREGCGIRRFAEDYTYMRSAPDEQDLWRIFGAEDTETPQNLSEDTSLKRAYKKRLLEGKPVYGGEGIFFYRFFEI